MLKNESYNKIIDKEKYIRILDDIGINNVVVSIDTSIYYEPKDRRFSEKEYQYEWLNLIIKNSKNEKKSVLKYIHTYPENEVYTSRSEEYSTEIKDEEQFQIILKNLDFIEAYKDIIKNIEFKLNNKYKVVLQNINENVYKIEITTLDYHYITKEDFKEIKDFLEKYNIIPEENF